MQVLRPLTARKAPKAVATGKTEGGDTGICPCGHEGKEASGASRLGALNRFKSHSAGWESPADQVATQVCRTPHKKRAKVTESALASAIDIAPLSPDLSSSVGQSSPEAYFHYHFMYFASHGSAPSAGPHVHPFAKSDKVKSAAATVDSGSNSTVFLTQSSVLLKVPSAAHVLAVQVQAFASRVFKAASHD